jgi:hypothetical protein
LKQLTVGLYSFIEDSKANLVENRQFRQMFGEWMAREEGRREAQRENTGRFDTAQQPRP